MDIRYHLKRCPFCGCKMEVTATAQLGRAAYGDAYKPAYQGYSADGNHKEGCPLEDEVIAMRKTPEECAECWNMRAPLAD